MKKQKLRDQLAMLDPKEELQQQQPQPLQSGTSPQPSPQKRRYSTSQSTSEVCAHSVTLPACPQCVMHGQAAL